MSDQPNMFELTGKIRPGQAAAISRVVAFRRRVLVLLEHVSKGEYSDDDLLEFLNLAGDAGLVLQISTPTLNERAGLGANFFQSVVRERRHPRLENMLKALHALAEIANERLGDDDGRDSRTDWVPNALRNDTNKVEALQRDLLEIIGILRTSNSLSEIDEVDRYWRETLVELLETVVVLLKAPLVERSLLKTAADALKTVPAKLTDYAVGGLVGSLATAAATALLGLL